MLLFFIKCIEAYWQVSVVKWSIAAITIVTEKQKFKSVCIWLDEMLK